MYMALLSAGGLLSQTLEGVKTSVSFLCVVWVGGWVGIAGKFCTTRDGVLVCVVYEVCAPGLPSGPASCSEHNHFFETTCHHTAVKA